MPTQKRAAAKTTSRTSSAKKPARSSAPDPQNTGAGKRLVIAEKPSVAADIARALGGFTKQGDYFESDGFVVCSAIGHLLELVAPEQYEVKRGKWSFAHLPVIPPHFDLRPIERTEERLKLLKRLIKRKDVTGLINACDAGREGELIFRYIVEHADTSKPIERLWLQSMTPAAIRDGFQSLRDDASMKPLADAAACRSESDWLIGINGTRAMTAFNSKDGGFYKTTVGRVQTPTLAVLVERESRIKSFQPRDYWEVRATFSAESGHYDGKWFDESFERSSKSEDADVRADRIWDESKALLIAQKCTGKVGTVTEESKPSTQTPPLLYDLTSLQREANGRFGFSAKTTLSLAQALYEKHKVLTYPRTDSRALPEDYANTVKATLGMLSGEHTAGRSRTVEPSGLVERYSSFASRILENNWVRPNKRIFNNEKISDHFAIIPTLEAPKHLTEIEQKLYDMVVRRFLAVFYPAAEHLITTRITRVADEPFKTEGKVLVNPGWLEVYGKEAQSDGDSLLVPVTKGKAEATEVQAVANRTKPPARFNEATLLSAMEGAGKLVDDEDLREAMSEKGLGTPATRAAIIEGLILEEYVLRDGRDLVPTAKAFDLLYALGKFGIDELRSPELTGTWEYKLKQMEQGQLKRADFMHHIVETTQDLVDRVKQGTLSDEPISTLSTACPRCGGTIVENYKKFACTKCDFALWKVIAGRRMEAQEIETLIRERSIGPVQGFRSKLGRPFAAMLRMKDDLTTEFDFGQGSGDAADQEPVDFGDQVTLGPCPKCGARVFDHGMAFVCEKSVGPARSCDFRSGKIILQRQIEPEQMRKLLATGRTDLLHRFISKKGRPFSAFLVRGQDGKVGFEFAPRGKSAASEAGDDKPKRATGGRKKAAGS
ncbi:MAG: DNA topoisomerase III [Betaproteobacteria bacterium]|nr:DNA topoisomerase III [Betaproteobacteria bacterium]